jgi:hypothetical protein
MSPEDNTEDDKPPDLAKAGGELDLEGGTSFAGGKTLTGYETEETRTKTKWRLPFLIRITTTVRKKGKTTQVVEARNYYFGWKFAFVAYLAIALDVTAVVESAPPTWHALIDNFYRLFETKSVEPQNERGPQESGFVLAGTMQAEAVHGDGNAFDTKSDQEIRVPLAKVDTSYHQTDGTMFSGGGAYSNLSFADIPAGLYIQCDGTVGQEKRWAVLRPYDGGTVLRENGVFKLGLYADSGSGFLDSGSAKVSVLVWYKPRGSIGWSLLFIVFCCASAILLLSLVSSIAFYRRREAVPAED